MCLRKMQRGKNGPNLGSYPDASPINQLSLVARTADNTRDDDMQSGIWKKRYHLLENDHNQGFFLRYLIKPKQAILLISQMLMV